MEFFQLIKLCKKHRFSNFFSNFPFFPKFRQNSFMTHQDFPLMRNPNDSCIIFPKVIKFFNPVVGSRLGSFGGKLLYLARWNHESSCMFLTWAIVLVENLHVVPLLGANIPIKTSDPYVAVSFKNSKLTPQRFSGRSRTCSAENFLIIHCVRGSYFSLYFNTRHFLPGGEALKTDLVFSAREYQVHVHASEFICGIGGFPRGTNVRQLSYAAHSLRK